MKILQKIMNKTTSEIVMKRMMKHPFGWLMLGLIIGLPKTPGFGQCKVLAKVKPVNCEINTNGAITLEVSGGTAPYYFEWNNGSQEQSLDNLPEGIYEVKVTDSKGLVTTKQATVNTYSSLKIRLAAKDVSSGKGNDGSLTAEVSGGKSPYQYQWISMTNAEKRFPSATNLSNLPKGAYLLVVQDANGCSVMAKARINNAGSLNK